MNFIMEKPSQREKKVKEVERGKLRKNKNLFHNALVSTTSLWQYTQSGRDDDKEQAHAVVD